MRFSHVVECGFRTGSRKLGLHIVPSSGVRDLDHSADTLKSWDLIDPLSLERAEEAFLNLQYPLFGRQVVEPESKVVVRRLVFSDDGSFPDSPMPI